MSASDVTLVARVVANDDRSAFENLVRRHEIPLRNFLRRLCSDDFARADDLAQETFIKVYRSISSFKGDAAFGTWHYRIAYNAFLDDQKRSGAVMEYSDDRDSAESDFTDQADREMVVSSALKKLSVRQQAVFDLHYMKDMSHTELAAVLDMPVGTVKSFS